VVGVIVSALVFAWRSSKQVSVNSEINDIGQKIYHIRGPLFFGSTASFQDMFNPKNDPDDVVVDFINSRVWDHSGLQAIETLADRYSRRNKTIHLRHLSRDCKALLHKTGSLVELMPDEDPDYGIAVDYDDYEKEENNSIRP